MAENGYESYYMLLNLGSPLYFFIAQFIYKPLFYVMSVILNRTGSPGAKKVARWLSKQISGTIFNSTLATLDALFLVMIFSSMVNIQNEEKAGGYDVSYVLSIYVFVGCMKYLILISTYFCRFKNELNEERHRSRCGYIYENLNLENGGWALAYPILYQLRFVLIVFLFLNLKYVVLQILPFMLYTVFILVVVGTVHPFKILPENYRSLAREAVILAVMDLFLIVSNSALPAKAQSYMGLMIVLIVSMFFAVFVGVLLYSSISTCIRYI